MKEKIEKFINKFISLEQEVRTLDLDASSKEEFNEKLLQMESLAIPEMKDTFGVVFKDEYFEDLNNFNWDEHFPNENTQDKLLEETKNSIAQLDDTIMPRHLFKIERYADEFYKVFLSVANPQGKTYGQCFIIKEIKNEYKIVAKYFLGSDDNLNFSWRFGAGDRKISFELGDSPIEIERYTTPKDDKKSIMEHNK